MIDYFDHIFLVVLLRIVVERRERGEWVVRRGETWWTNNWCNVIM